MTGSLQIRKTSSTKEYYYVLLRFKNSDGKWKTKSVSTGIEVKPGNKRKAQSLINIAIENNISLEEACGFNAQSTFDPDITLNEFLDYWLNKKASEIDAITHETYTYRINIIKNILGKNSIKIKDISPQVLENFYQYMLSSGKVRPSDGSRGPMAVRTVNSYKNLITQALDHAMIHNIIAANPSRIVKVTEKKNKDFKQEICFLSRDEIRAFIELLSDKYPELKEIAFFAIFYGLRRSELIGLKWNAIDFNKKLMTIRHTIVRSKTIHEKESTKTVSSRRILDIIPDAENVLECIQNTNDNNKCFFGKEYNASEYIFVNEKGVRIKPDWLTKRFKKAFKDFGMPEMSLHKLRHTCASLLIEQGWQPKRVQYWLGHADITTTLNIYAHYDRIKQNSFADDLAEVSRDVSQYFSLEKQF